MSYELARLAACLAIAAGVTDAASAASLRLAIESDADRGPGGELDLTSFPTFADLLASPSQGGPGGCSGIDIASGFSVVGLAYEPDPVAPAPDPMAPAPVPAAPAVGLMIAGLGALWGARRGA